MNNNNKFNLESVKDGIYTISIRENDKYKYLHSRRDPLRETERFFSKHPIYEKTKLVFLLGIGAGHYIHYILKNHPQVKIIAVEPDYDFCEWIKTYSEKIHISERKNLSFIYGKSRENWLDILDVSLTIETITRLQVINTPCVIDEKGTVEFVKTLNDSIEFRKKNFYI